MDKYDVAKSATDITAVGGTLGALFDYLPAGVTILTGIWTVIRIYETVTFQKFLAKMRGVFKV